MERKSMPVQEAIESLSNRLRQAEDIVLQQQKTLISVCADLAVPLVLAGMIDRETLITSLEKLSAEDPTPNHAALAIAELLKATRPWGVIEGGKPDPDDEEPPPAA